MLRRWWCKSVLKNPKDLEQGNYTTNLKILTVAFSSGMFTKSSQNPQFIRNSMLASKIEQGFVRFAHEMFRYDIRSTYVDMEKLKTKHKGKVFKYVLSVMDVFSRYQWLVPLERKLSSHVARELLRI